MSRVPLRFWALGAVLFLLNVGGLCWIRAAVVAGQRQVRIIAALPEQNADSADRLTLVFDQPCADGQQIGQPLARAPFVLTPGAEGGWVWAAPERLEFRLGKRLPPGRVFTLRAAPDVEAVLARKLVGQTEFRFETRSLVLQSWEFVAVDQTHATFTLLFNQPVHPAELLRFMRATDPSCRRDLEPTVLTAEPAERLTIRLRRPLQDEALLELNPHLTGCDAELPLGTLVVEHLKVTRRFALLFARADCSGLESDIDVGLRFSRELDLKQTVPTISVEPPVEGLRARLDWNGIILTGRFACNRRYTASVPPTLISKCGELLAETQTATFEVPDRSPALAFAANNGILSPAGGGAVEVSAVNVSALQLTAARLHANNLVAALHEPREPESVYRELPEKTVPLRLLRNTPTKMLLDVRGLIDQPSGIFRVRAMSPDCEWVQDTAIVALTDLALTAKTYPGGAVVWVTSLRSAQPVAGSTVTALSQNNQVLGRGTTDADGLVRLDIPTKHPDGPVWVITAEQDGDLSFLRPECRAWLLDDVDQKGRTAAVTYDVLLYTERGVYRPGDAVHLTGIVRDAAGQVPPPFPLTVRIARPDGRQVADVPVSVDAAAQGMFHCDYATPGDGQLGRYRFTVSLPGADEVLGQTQALVEEFVPVRLAVSAQAAQARFGPNEAPRIDVQARYLFDQPAAGLPLSVTGEFRRVPFQSAHFPGFSFGEPKCKETWRLPPIARELDGSGQAEIALTRPESTGRGVWSGDLAASVTNPGGRSTTANVAILVDTADRHIGLKLPAGNVVVPGAPAQLEWVFVDGADAAAEGRLEFELLRVEYDSTLEIVNQRPVWKSVERLTPIWKRQVSAAASGPTALDLEAKDFGEYRVRATHPDSKSTTALDFHVAYGADQADPQTFNRPERLTIVLDRDTYEPGSLAKVTVRSPISGTLLLTLESDRVLDQRIVAAPNGAAEIDLPVPATLRGGAFVSGILVRPVDPTQNKWLPHRAIGLARLMTDHRVQTLPVSIAAPSQVRPGSTISVHVQTQPPGSSSAPASAANSQPTANVASETSFTASAPAAQSQPTAASAPAIAPAMVHLWAVDEGILQTTSYAVTNPREHFLGPRALQVASADVFGDLLPDYARPADMTHIGGDAGGYVEPLLRSPVSTRSQAPAVLWRTCAPVGPDGTLSVTLDLPNITGEIRLMAVAVAGDRYGAAQRPVTTTTPLLVEASWPRLVAPGDRFQVPIKLFNTSDAALSTTLELAISGPIEAALPTDQHMVTLVPGQPQTIWLIATATGIGVANADVIARANTSNGEQLIETSTATFPVRPVAPLASETAFLRIEAGADTPLEIPGDYLPGTGRATLTISAQPQVELLPALEQLLEYPYGCVEQTTSRLYALLHTPELLVAHDAGAGRVGQVQDMINAGLLRLWSMQTRDGGLSYWPGGQGSDLWPSAYVGELLVAARHAGYTPEPRFVTELAKYLAARLNQLTPRNDIPEPAADVRALICRVLAGLGQPQEGWQARLSERLDELDMAGRAHLAAAWLETGRRDRALAALPPDTIDLMTTTSAGGRITSQTQQQAALLGVLLDLDTTHPWIPVLVQKLNAARTDGCWANTLENAAALAALARYQLIGLKPSTFSGEFRVGDQLGLSFDSSSPTTLRFDMTDEPARLMSTGDGHIFVTVQTRGLATDDDLPPTDRGLRVRREWTNSSGQQIDPAGLRVGELVYVQVSLEALHLEPDESIENVAIVDALPGGLEVENPELTTAVRRAAGVPDDDPPDRVEFRDDRVILFASAGPQERKYHYVLRAVAAGTFAIPPIEATCMYDPGVISRHGGGTLEVQR